jgi:hypothetical protein
LTAREVSASKRHWNEDLVEPEVEVTSKATICVPKTPGIGYAARRDRIDSSQCVETIGAASGRRPRVVHKRMCSKPRNKVATAIVSR